MPKQLGIIKLDGTIGDLTFYKKDGQHFARSKGGVSADKIKNDPKFVRTRENMAEFGHAGKMSKAFRNAIRALLEKAKDSRVSNRLSSVISRAIKADTVSNRGERNLVKGEIMFLKGFEFNINGRLDSTLFASSNASIDAAAQKASLTMDLNPLADMKSPAGATHFQITNAALVMNLEDTTEQELALDSTGMKVLEHNIIPVNLEANFNLAPAGKVIFQFVLIEFLQEVNGKFYNLKNGAFNCMQLVNIQK